MFCFVLFKTVEKRKMTIKKGRKTKPRKKIQERKKDTERAVSVVWCVTRREKKKRKNGGERNRERERERKGTMNNP